MVSQDASENTVAGAEDFADEVGPAPGEFAAPHHQQQSAASGPGPRPGDGVPISNEESGMASQDASDNTMEGVEEFAHELRAAAGDSADADQAHQSPESGPSFHTEDGVAVSSMEKERLDQVGFDNIRRIPVEIRAILGGSKIDVARLMALTPGEIVSLDRRVGEPVDLIVNDQIVARGQIVMLEEDGERLGVSVTEIVSGG